MSSVVATVAANLPALSQPPSRADATAAAGASNASFSAVADATGGAVISDSATNTQGPMTQESAAAVNDALYMIEDANGGAMITRQIDWGEVAAKFGNAIAARDEESVQGSVTLAAKNAMAAASQLNIPVSDSANPQEPGCGSAPGVLTLRPFSFADNGSDYSVTQDSEGVFVGTRDGINDWQSWQINPYAVTYTGGTPSTVAALQALAVAKTEAGSAKLNLST